MTPPADTAETLGLMCGFPPQVRVSHAQQLLGPYNRWSFQNIQRLNPTADVWRGQGVATALPLAPRDLSQVRYHNRAGQAFSFDDMVEMSYTDGIMVLHHGHVIYQCYLNGMQPHTLHAWASGSKSMTGVLASLLAHEGLFDPAAPITDYLPELAGSGWAGASVQQIMDMTTAVQFREDEVDPISENWQYSVVMGWRARPEGYAGAETIYEFLPTMRQSGPHGQRFTYLTPNTDVLAWLLMRRSGRTLAGLMSERIWQPLRADLDAHWVVGPAAFETAGSGLLTTLPDMARFGQMLLQRGAFGGQQIIPAAVVGEIERGGEPVAYANGSAANPMFPQASYHNQWWFLGNDHRAYYALGYGGQMLYIDPVAQMVVAKMSSFPTPTPAGNEFYSAFAALPVLGQVLAAE
ncbi:serine hydrolase [Chloroflexia bacterium SDU3-3]|nr:serine hydrolase [Chloroflexia bacterium SDU3-3]